MVEEQGLLASCAHTGQKILYILNCARAVKRRYQVYMRLSLEPYLIVSPTLLAPILIASVAGFLLATLAASTLFAMLASTRSFDSVLTSSTPTPAAPCLVLFFVLAYVRIFLRGLLSSSSRVLLPITGGVSGTSNIASGQLMA